MAVMVVGVGFGSILFGSIAQRFVSPQVREEAEEVEREVEATEDELLGELRDLSARLRRIEAVMERRRGEGSAD
jgi:hypothetical protein